MELLLTKFNADSSRLLHLFISDPHIRNLCEEYGAALTSSQAWSGRPEIARQFRCMAVEIQMELEDILGNRSLKDLQ
ncbi:hypothetical protein [Tropicimonas sp. TH_r6]|uniref:hypothetical protein n=1 Tax=Tropicimonas sp. TH_r6 TaxID=3082085 RepID=UPI0029553D0D|nr:hypothetical protein [Tropicimonas sp. TH_r6]